MQLDYQSNHIRSAISLSLAITIGLASVVQAASGPASSTVPKSNNPKAAAAGVLAGVSGSVVAPVKVNFTDCGSKNVKDVRISPCPGDGTVCNINLGTNVTVEADFVAKHEASSLSEVIHGIIRGRELQFPEQRSDPCRSTISPACPIKVGKFYQYRATFEIKPYYPAIPVKVRYALANQVGDIVACVQIAAKIIDPTPIRSSRLKSKNKKP